MSTSKEKLRELCLKEGKSFFQNKNQLKKYIETTLNDYSDCNQLRIITEYDIASKVFTDVTSRDDYKNIKKCVDILVEDYMWKESLAIETVDTFVYAKFGDNKVTQTPKEPVKVAPDIVDNKLSKEMTSKEKLRELCLKEGKSFFQNKNQLKEYIETTLNDYSDCNQLRIVTEYDIASKVFTDVTSRDDYKNIKKCVDILVEDYMWKESLANETVDTFVYAKFGNNKVTQTPKEPVKVAPAVVIKETPEDMNQKGVKYSDEEKYVEAVKWFKLAAEQGNADAQYNLGDCYFLGNGVEKDLKEAVKWYKLAAEQGSADVQYDLGDCYYLGNGVEVDYKESLKWYRLSAEQGNADSQNMVGICYYFGRGVEIDYKEAINWFKLAEAQGKIIAKFNIGRCYENGFGVDKNEAEAVKWYKLGAAAGDKNSQEALDNINKSKSAATNTTQVIEKIPTPTVTPDPKKETTVWSVLAYIISLPFKIISAILNVLWTIIVIAIIVLVIISWLF